MTLRDAREAAGLSQRRLAERIHCSRSYIDSFEREKYQPTLAAFMVLACEIGVSEEDLLRQVKCNLALLNNRAQTKGDVPMPEWEPFCP